jgi:hypothetical protein
LYPFLYITAWVSGKSQRLVVTMPIQYPQLGSELNSILYPRSSSHNLALMNQLSLYNLSKFGTCDFFRCNIDAIQHFKQSVDTKLCLTLNMIHPIVELLSNNGIRRETPELLL